MEQITTMRDYIILFIKGFVIGIANAIPGVSGGTLAFILGIYEKLTNSIAIIPSIIFKPKQWISPMKILIPVGLGASIAVVVFLNIIEILFTTYPVPTQIFFVGLILGSLPFVTKEVKGFGIKNLISFGFGALIMGTFIYFAMISDKESAIVTYSTMSFSYAIKLFVSGILAAAAMVIPGISGSLLLLMLGEYRNISIFVKNIEIIPLAIVTIGIAIGIFFVTKIISIIIAKWREQLFSFVLALIVVSLLSIWPSMTSDLSIPMVVSSIASMCIGFLLAIGLEKL